MPSKTNWLSLALTSLAASVVVGSPRPNSQPVVGHIPRPADLIRESGRIAIGSDRAQVVNILGEPDLRLNEIFWIYWNCRVTPEEANPQGFDSLIIIFQQDRVVTLKASDGETIRRNLQSSKNRS